MQTHTYDPLCAIASLDRSQSLDQTVRAATVRVTQRETRSHLPQSKAYLHCLNHSLSHCITIHCTGNTTL